MQVTLLVLLVLIPSITTLRCYVCNENVDRECGSDSNLKAFVTPCKNVTEPHCRKIVQTVNNVKTTVRTCGSKGASKDCYKTAGTNSANVCSCKTDLCNHAPSFTQQQQTMTILSSVVVMATTMLVLR